MAQNKQQDIPQEIRDLTVKNIGQAHAAYNQLMEAANKAQEMMKGIIPSNPVTAGITEAQERAMRFTQQNPRCRFLIGQRACQGKRPARGAANPKQARAIADASLCASGAGAWHHGGAAAQKAKQGS